MSSLYFNTPDYYCFTSLVENKTKIMGNIDLATDIENKAKEFISQNKSLYEAQQEIVRELTEIYGKDWYERSAEAVNFIIENEYANDERSKNFIFDKKQYEYDKKHNVCY